MSESETTTATFYERMIALMEGQSMKKGDLSYRVEGVFETMRVHVNCTPPPEAMRVRLAQAVVTACGLFSQAELDREKRPVWTTNHIAVKLLIELGFSSTNRVPAPPPLSVAA